MRSCNWCILDLVNDFWVLRLLSKGNMFRLDPYRLIKKLLIEIMIFLIVFAVCNIESFVPGTCVKLGVFFARAPREARPCANLIFLETDTIL